MFKVCFCLLALCSVAFSSSVFLQSSPKFNFEIIDPNYCGGYIEIIYLGLAGCTTQPCIVKPGESYDLDIVIPSSENYEALNLIGHAIIGGIPFEIINTDINALGSGPYNIVMPIQFTEDLGNFCVRIRVFGFPGKIPLSCKEICFIVQS